MTALTATSLGPGRVSSPAPHDARRYSGLIPQEPPPSGHPAVVVVPCDNPPPGPKARASQWVLQHRAGLLPGTAGHLRGSPDPPPKPTTAPRASANCRPSRATSCHPKTCIANHLLRPETSSLPFALSCTFPFPSRRIFPQHRSHEVSPVQSFRIPQPALPANLRSRRGTRSRAICLSLTCEHGDLTSRRKSLDQSSSPRLFSHLKGTHTPTRLFPKLGVLHHVGLPRFAQDAA